MIRKKIIQPPNPNSSPAVTPPLEKHRWLRRIIRLFWQGKILPAFWTIASIFSIVVNVILIVVLVLIGRQLFAIKSLVQEGLIGGLYQNFVLMDQAHIQTTIQVHDTIQVQDTIPINFSLPLKQATDVILTKDTAIPNTAVYLNGVPIYTTVVLPQGTPLNIELNLQVPVSQTIPVVLKVPINLTVPVDIPLDETQLHQPFVGLQSVVSPYRQVLGVLPGSWDETPACGNNTQWLCQWLFDLK